MANDREGNNLKVITTIKKRQAVGEVQFADSPLPEDNDVHQHQRSGGEQGWYWRETGREKTDKKKAENGVCWGTIIIFVV